MDIKEQVCSFELAKRLKELGVVQNRSYFVWYRIVGTDRLHTRLQDLSWYLALLGEGYACDAFSVAELGKIIFEIIRKVSGDFAESIGYEFIRLTRKSNDFQLELEANVRAKLLIYICSF